jgi:hypothetical protein
MPKQIFQNGVLSVQLDPNDPNDAHELKIKGNKGASIATLLTNPQAVTDLLTALNAEYNLGLKP